MSGSAKSTGRSLGNSLAGSADTGVSGNSLYHSLHAQIKRSNEPAKSTNGNSEKGDARKMLGKYYNLDTTIPADVSEKVFAQNTNVMSERSDSATPSEKDFLEQVIQDTKKFSKEQREKIAHSVLTGSFEVADGEQHRDDGKVPNPMKRASDIQRTKEKLLYLQRHNLPKPHFLELSSEAAHVPVLDAATMRLEKLKMLRNRTVEHSMANVRLEPGLDWHDTLTNAAVASNAKTIRPQSNRAASRPASATVITKNGVIEITDEMPKTPMVHADQALSKSMSLPGGRSGTQKLGSSLDGSMKKMYSKLILDDKMRKVKLAKEQQIRERERIKRQNEYDKLTIEKRTEIRKKIQEFRKQVKDYLIKKRDPLMGDIMRSLDDSMVYYLLEKYDGFSMSPEAILSMITNNLAQLLIDPVPIDNIHFPGDATQSAFNEHFFLTETDLPHNQELPNHTANSTLSQLLKTGVSLPDLAIMNHIEHTASLSAEKSYNSLVNNYQSFGKRSPPRSRSPEVLHSSNNINSTEVSLDSRSYGNEYMKRNHDAVIGYDLRRIEFDLRPPQGDKTLGSGFRATGRAMSPQHRHDRSPSPYAGESGAKAPLIVLSSEHVKSVRLLHGFDPSMLDDSVDDSGTMRPEVAARYRADEEEDDVRSVNSLPSLHSTHSMFSMLSNGAMSQATKEAISAMHEQLLEEGILPSLEPDTVLSDKQIKQLGLHEKSIEDIIDELGGKKKKVKAGSIANSDMPYEESSIGELTNDPDLPAVGDPDSNKPFSPATNRTSKASRGGGTLSSFQINSMVDEENRTAELGNQAHQQFEKNSSPDERLMVFDENNDLNHPPLLFHGATRSLQLQISAEKLRRLAELEVEKGEKRLILPALRPNKADKYLEFVAEFPGLEKEPKIPSHLRKESPRKGPMAIKSKAKYEQRNGMTNLPVSPYKSLDMEMKVMNTGVPAGAGLMLWRPKEVSTGSGRLRVGKQSSTNSKFNETKDGKHIPFVSAA